MAAIADFGTLAIDPVAAAQQTAIISALYFDRQDIANAVIGEQGTILRWVHQPDSWPPSYAVIASGGAYLVAMAGTSNVLASPPAYIAGTWMRSGVLPGAATNGAFAQAAQAIWADARQLLPADLGGKTVRLSGHSYGGALAELLTLLRRGDTPAATWQCLTLGAARPSTSGFTGVVPTMWHLTSSGDPVYYLPPSADVIPYYRDWAEPLSFVLQYPLWIHYGRSVILGTRGIGDTGEDVTPLPPNVLLGPGGQHSLLNYAGRQLAPYPPGVLNATTIPLNLAVACFQRQAAQSVAPGLPTTAIGPAGEVFTVPFYSGVPPPPSESLGNAMGYPVQLTGGTPYRCVRKKNLPDGGCSDTFVLWVSGSDQTEQEKNLKSAISKVCLAMVNAESTEVVSIQVRASIVGQPRSGKSYYFDDGINLGNGTKSGVASLTNVSYDIKTLSRTGGSVGNMQFRGLPQTDTQVLAGGADQTPVPTNVTALCAALKAAVVTQPQNNTLGAIAAMRVVDANPATNPTRVVRAFGLSVDGYLTISVTTPLVGAARGEYMTVALNRDDARCLSGISGTYRIIDISTTVDPTVYTLRHRPCCPQQDLSTATGTVRMRAYIYTALGDYKPFQVSTRDTGKGGSSRRGRRRGRCC